MNYEVRRQGQSLGVFPLEELRRRRQAGEFTGGEYVQGEGMVDWQPLDLVLQQGYRLTPPPLPANVRRNQPNSALIWTSIVGGAVLIFAVVLAFGVLISKIQKDVLPFPSQPRQNIALNESNPGALAIASRPIVWTTNTLTSAIVQKQFREFRIRQWVDGYEERGERHAKCDAEADLFIRTYVDRNYGGPEATNSMSLEDESDKLANDPNCTDPLVLTVAGDENVNLFNSMHLFERALAAYPNSKHKAYPKLYATVKLAGLLGQRSDRTGELETSALQLFKQCFSDGTFTTNDQQEIAEILITGWGDNFFEQNGASICRIAHDAGSGYKWLALTLDGEHEIDEAWAARGGGYSDSVTDAGWRGFNSHLASARSDLTSAWNLQANWPMAPARMIYVSLGDAGLDEMRTWFDRTTQAQIDYPLAWKHLRWGLRPRWYGNEQAMLALGVAAVKTGRFDTDVPRKYLDCVYDVESEMELSTGQHIYGRDDIWPNLKKMYDGYVSDPSQKQGWDGWRTSYAVVAYFARKYDVARDQLAALNWKPLQPNMQDWNVDLSLMSLEVAARTGALGKQVSVAEIERNSGEISAALDKYTKLKDSPDADERTREFIQHRLSELSAEQRLGKGEWISLLPASDDDPNWVFSFGKSHVLPDGALEVECGPKGHMLFSRVRAGADFEVRGQFELIHSDNKNFQGGVVMGVPDFDGYEWYGFRLKRHGEEGDSACFARGWSRDQIVQHLVLNDVTNSFDMTFRDGQVTATVNGVMVFDHCKAPVELNVPNNSYLIGLGAFNDTADSIIRYRSVQLRKL